MQSFKLLSEIYSILVLCFHLVYNLTATFISYHYYFKGVSRGLLMMLSRTIVPWLNNNLHQTNFHSIVLENPFSDHVTIHALSLTYPKYFFQKLHETDFQEINATSALEKKKKPNQGYWTVICILSEQVCVYPALTREGRTILYSRILCNSVTKPKQSQ